MIGIDQLIGVWEGAEQVSATAWTAAQELKGRVELRAGPASRSLLLDYWQLRGSEVVMRGHGVVLDDGWWWFDSLGFAAPEPGLARWEEDALVLVRTSPRGSNQTTFRVVGDVLEQQIDVAVPIEADPAPLLRGTYTRTATS